MSYTFSDHRHPKLLYFNTEELIIMENVARLKTLYKNGGIREVYRGIRDFMRYSFYNPYLVDNSPRVFGVHAGVIHRNSRLLAKDHRRDRHKCGLMSSIEKYVKDGDSVTLVALGQGLTTVHAIRAGAGDVTAYEGSEKMISIAQETFELNLTPREYDRITIRHAVVGNPINVWGNFDEDAAVDPADLLCGDVLILDCEGSELSILSGLQNLPQIILCETHPQLGSSKDSVAKVMKKKGYETNDLPLHDPDVKKSNKSVIIGTRQE